MDLSENFKNLLIEFSNYYKDTCKYDKYKENNDPVMCVYSEMLINNLLGYLILFLVFRYNKFVLRHTMLKI